MISRSRLTESFNLTSIATERMLIAKSINRRGDRPQLYVTKRLKSIYKNKHKFKIFSTALLIYLCFLVPGYILACPFKISGDTDATIDLLCDTSLVIAFPATHGLEVLDLKLIRRDEGTSVEWTSTHAALVSQTLIQRSHRQATNTDRHGQRRTKSEIRDPKFETKAVFRRGRWLMFWSFLFCSFEFLIGSPPRRFSYLVPRASDLFFNVLRSKSINSINLFMWFSPNKFTAGGVLRVMMQEKCNAYGRQGHHLQCPPVVFYFYPIRKTKIQWQAVVVKTQKKEMPHNERKLLKELLQLRLLDNKIMEARLVTVKEEVLHIDKED